jgi:glutamate synthase (NADPH/NADH) large chain
VQPGMSDSASLDNVLEFLIMSGLSLPHAMACSCRNLSTKRIPSAKT